MNGMDLPMVGPLIHRIAYAGEVYKFWDHYFRGFSMPYRDLTADDADPKSIRKLNESFNALITRNRSRVFVKITGWPRIGFLLKVFPDAKFIYLYRDGRAAAYSYLQTPWCDVWKGPGNWAWGPLTDAEFEKWHELDQSFFALAGILWEKMSNQFEQTRTLVDESNFLSLSYESLCDNKNSMISTILDFAELELTNDFRQLTESFRLRANNDKWRKALDSKQQDYLTKSMADMLTRYNYV